MFTRLAVAGLGLYVIGTWTAVALVAYHWFNEPAAVHRVAADNVLRVSPNTVVIAAQ